MILTNFSKLNLKALVCGAGSIGQRHLQNLRLLGIEPSLWRAQPSKRSEIAHEMQIETYSDLETAVQNCDFVVVATATDNHLHVIQKAVQTGKHIYIEKPISHTLTGLSQLINEIEKKQLTTEVGCMLRSSDTLQKLKSYIDEKFFGNVLTYRSVMGQSLDQWRPTADYKTSYSANKERGGGALMDLIHQIDLAEYLFGMTQEVFCSSSTNSQLAINADHISNLTLHSINNVTGQIQIDMVSPVYRGQLEVVTEKAVLFWDIESNILKIKLPKNETIINPEEGFQRNHLFLRHMETFVSRLTESSPTKNRSLYEGVSALEVVLTAYESNTQRRSLAINRLVSDNFKNRS